MRILITGATGFIGRHVLADSKIRQHQLLLLMRMPEDALATGNVQQLQGSLEDIEACMEGIVRFDPEVCIHLAWSGIPDFSLEMCQKNLNQSVGFLNALAEKTQCRKFILSGSCFEYGATEGICAEDRPAVIHSYFSWAKHALYEFSAFLASQKKLTLVWLRFFYVYGPGQRSGSLVPTMVQSLKQQKKPQVNNPFNANDFVYVSDVASAVAHAVESQAPSGIYNVGSGHAHRVIDVCRAAEKSLSGKDDFSRELDRSSAVAAANFWADPSKSRQLLGWQAETSLEDGIMRYVHSLRVS